MSATSTPDGVKPDPSSLLVAGVQHDIMWGDRAGNYRRLEPMAAAAVAQGARLVVFAETFPTGFTVGKASDESSSGGEEPFDGPTAEFLSGLAVAQGVYMAGSCLERDAEGLGPYNCMLLVTPTGQIFRYRKIHPFSYAKEDDHIESGSERVTVSVDGLRVSLAICYDLRFANLFWSQADHTDLFVISANWPKTRVAHWEVLLRARAIENQAYVLGVNRVGSGGGIDYSGRSKLVDPMGEVLDLAGAGESLVLGRVSATRVESVRDEFPFHRDRKNF